MLEEYRRKRDLARTSEPAPQAAPSGQGPLTFVVQKHAARRLHYDLRLEVDGVLKSWSVPKGPSLDPREKRLAVMVEDHPLDYASFEGVIPKGEYGAGQVIVWDAGTYSPDEDGRLSFHDRQEAEERARRGLAEGKLSVFLRGRKLRGSWALVKTRRGERDWLLIKHQDQFAEPQGDVLAQDRSVSSGLTIEDLKVGRRPDKGRRSAPVLRPQDLPAAQPAPFPTGLKPMLATPTDQPFSSPDWLFEPKLDGVRILAFIRAGEVILLSRRGNDVTAQYPSLVAALAGQAEAQLVLDGEVVALDQRGVPSFQLLQRRLNLTREADIRRAEAAIPVVYYVFDLPYIDGIDLRGAPLVERKALLEQILLPPEGVRYLDHLEAEGEEAYRAALDLGLEGVVAKRRDSPYEAGRRSRHWLKVKAVQAEEFVVAGYSQGQGARAETFGSLLLGYYDGQGRLVYAGHVGSGFDDAALADLRSRLDALRSDDCPFAQIPVEAKAGVTWVRPQLVAEVKFSQWTEEGHLRAPVFLRLRQDKEPSEVVLTPLPPSSTPREEGRGKREGEAIAHLLEQLENPRPGFTIVVQGHKIALNNLDKALWPALDDRRPLTKRDLIAYYARVAPYVLPHLEDRPLTLTRYPDGIEGEYFYQKHWDNPLPDFVETVRLYSEHNRGDVEYLLCNNLPTLIWLGQLADLELHTWFSRTDREPDAHHLRTAFAGSEENIDASVLSYPDFIVFDLDPYLYSGREGRGDEPQLHRRGFAKTCQVALWLKELLDSLALSAFLKTSGRTGLHVYVPVLRRYDYGVIRRLCEVIGQFLLRAHPRDITMEWTVEKRTGKVFLDVNQNVRGKTLASLYSPRPLPQAAVSMPLRWEELGQVYPTDFTILTAPQRLAEVGDLWAGILDAKHDLDAALKMASGGEG